MMELRHIRRDRRAQAGLLVNPLMFLLVASGRDGDIPGSHVPAANQVIGGGIASVIFLAAMTWLPQKPYLNRSWNGQVEQVSRRGDLLVVGA
jgi:hypothetical protein